jgi:EpsI family protein
MTETRRSWGSLVLASILILAALLVLTLLFLAARSDDDLNAWRGRALGFVMGFGTLAVAVAMIRFPGNGKTHYWGLVSSLTFAALLTGAYWYKPQAAQMGERAESIPLALGDWRGIGLVVGPENEEVLQTKDIIMRQYLRRGERVMLAVVFAESKRKVAHPPEQCYAAAGEEIDNIGDDSFTTKAGQTISARQLVITSSKTGKTQAVLYWYKAGDYSTGNFVEQQLHVILSSLLMRSDVRVGLIRLSTYLAEAEPAETAMARLKSFAQDLYPEVEKALE